MDVLSGRSRHPIAGSTGSAMLDRSFCMRNSFTIPPGCRERFAALAHPAVAGWPRAGVATAGESELVPGYAIANPRPERVMVIVTVAGRGAAVTPAAAHALTAGTLFVGPPGVP